MSNCINQICSIDWKAYPMPMRISYLVSCTLPVNQKIHASQSGFDSNHPALLVYDPIASQFNKNKRNNVLEFLSDKCLRTSRRKSRLGLPKINFSKDFHFLFFQAELNHMQKYCSIFVS